MTARLEELRRSRDALILAHSYQPPAVQDIADFVGDSLELCREAARSDRSVIVVCGVTFMAETAAILTPGRTVLHPEPSAGCPLADCMREEHLLEMMAGHPGAPAVVYVNSTAALKALAWSCCTSANVLEVVEAAPGGEVLFGPDRNLGLFAASRTGKTLHIFEGGCPPHAGADISHARAAKTADPGAELLVHPETPPEMWALADAVLGTGGMIYRVSRSEARRFLIGTEQGMVHRLRTLFPGRRFEAVGRIRCPNMKKITLESIETCLERMAPVVQVPPALAARAARAVERMASIG
jgi:quinolinate synthase